MATEHQVEARHHVLAAGMQQMEVSTTGAESPKSSHRGRPERRRQQREGADTATTSTDVQGSDTLEVAGSAMAGACEQRPDTPELARAVWDDGRHCLDETGSIGQGYFIAWAATAQAGMRAALDLQYAAIQASQRSVAVATQTSLQWFDQAAMSIRQGQDAMGRLVAAGFEAVGRAF